VGGIPRFVRTDDAGQKQTESSFAFKWGRTESYDGGAMRSVFQEWFLARYGFASSQDAQAYFAPKRVLDAGCGSGFSAAIWMPPGGPSGGFVGMDISGAVDVARQRLGADGRCDFVQGDVLSPPLRRGSFDAIVSEGVLHHTPSTKGALLSLSPLLASGGEFLFYVYRKKAPVREFTDDYVREQIAKLPPEEAWNALRSLTLLGKALADLRTEVEVPEDVPLLGIQKGKHDVQRLIYWHFAKMFWNPAYSVEENNHINFDWYHPRYSHRQTEAEVRRWCDEAGLDIERFHPEESGFTVRARRR
jgi:SAM-dependent methyltransferase